MRCVITILVAVLCPLALAATAAAVTITAGGVTEFDSGGFEADTVGENPAVTTVGSWIVTEAPDDGGSNVEVYGPASGGPGPARGEKYLSVSRPGTGNSSYPNALALMANAAAPGASVVAEQSLYFDSSSTEAQEFQVSFVKGTSDPWGDRHNWMTFNATGAGNDMDMWYYYWDEGHHWNRVTTGGGTIEMQAPHDAWTDVRLDLIVGQSYTVTVDGVTSDTMSIASAHAGDSVVGLQYCLTNGSKPGTFYVDGSDGDPPSPIPGDANRDRVVDDKDASILAAHWQQSGEGIGWGDGDFNDDGVVDDKDASIMAAHWLQTGEGGTAPIPEPGTLVLLAGALLSLLVWRRR